MLGAKTNRLDYGEQLIPRDNSYELDYAIGTTYSLDLEAIMVLPVAMFYSRLLDCSPDDLHFDVLDAITQSASKIRVYCQKGKIKVPKKYNRLMAYWEKGISEIRMDSAFSSFHPKVWVVRFTKKGCAPFYRLMITSRNLTYAHDWDIAFASEGEVGQDDIEKNKPLVNFLQYLGDKDGKKDCPAAFLADLGKVNFKLPDGYQLMNFHPIGIRVPDGELASTNPLAKRSWDDLLVVSPFVDKTTIETLATKTAGKLSLLSRREELDKIDAGTIEDLGENRVYHFSELIRDGERQEGVCDGERLEVRLQDLHAKIFIGEKSGYSYWFMGSANCTQPAFTAKNVEFMVELKTDQAKLVPSKVLKSLTDTKKSDFPLFEAYQLNTRPEETVENSVDSEFRKIIYDLSGLTYVGELASRTVDGHTLYDLCILCDAGSLAIPKGFTVRVKPLPDMTALPKALMLGQANRIEDFKGYSELQLSPYLEIHVVHSGSDNAKLFIAEMQMELPATRMDAIFRSIIDDKEKFLKYLAFLLNRTTPEPVKGGNEPPKPPKKKGDGQPDAFTASLYENLLEAASRRPERLRSVEKIIQRLSNDTESSPVLTEEFLKLWSIFLQTLANGDRR